MPTIPSSPGSADVIDKLMLQLLVIMVFTTIAYAFVNVLSNKPTPVRPARNLYLSLPMVEVTNETESVQIQYSCSRVQIPGI